MGEGGIKNGPTSFMDGPLHEKWLSEQACLLDRPGKRCASEKVSSMKG